MPDFFSGGVLLLVVESTAPAVYQREHKASWDLGARWLAFRAVFKASIKELGEVLRKVGLA